MIQKNKKFNVINTVSELHQLMCLSKSKQQLYTLIKLETIKSLANKEDWSKIVLNLYCISFIKSFKGKLKYGQKYYNCNIGGMMFIAPGQVFSLDIAQEESLSGYGLFFHPDFIIKYALSQQIKNYNFFSYEINESLHFSKKEEIMIKSIFKKIEFESNSPLDTLSHNIIVSSIELLLNYSNRLYHMQYIESKQYSNDLIIELEKLLDEYFCSDKVKVYGLPTVRYISEKLNVTPNYLSYVIKTRTGQTTQQHIHNKFVENAKRIIATTSLPVNDIAHQLGFEHPQYFSEIFKKKTSYSPLEYRNIFI